MALKKTDRELPKQPKEGGDPMAKFHGLPTTNVSDGDFAKGSSHLVSDISERAGSSRRRAS